MSKLSLGGKASDPKITSWVQPSFGDLFGGASVTAVPSNKQVNPGNQNSRAQSFAGDTSSKRTSKKRAAAPIPEQLGRDPLSQNQHDPWVDRHSPRTQGELAVHKKKTEEVENWLKSHVGHKHLKEGGSILLMTGPSGCGKTATIQVLAKEHGIQVQEWINPTTSSQYGTEDFKQAFDPKSSFNSFYSGSQSAVFQEFLLRANKYNCLQMVGDDTDAGKKVILVEDLPNQFYRQPSLLHDILRRFVRTGRCPLIFIISDSLSGDGNARLLFPKDIQDELNICNISFNPVAPTSLLKVLSRIVSQEASRSGGKIRVPDKACLELLCSGSSGDIRSAINSLQFSSLADSTLESSLWPLKKGKSSKLANRGGSKGRSKGKSSKLPGKQDAEQAVGGKDASLFLFRALGKILHCKREPHVEPEVPGLPAHLTEHQRDALLVDPEMVVEKSHMSGELFNLYLQQNYVEFFTEIEDVARASEYLSDADFLSAEWSSQSTMREYGSSVATRGMIHSNRSRAFASSQTGVGFKPLHKPHWLLISKKYRENCQAAQALFVSFCLTPVSLQTELLPYLAQLTNPMRNQAQIAFIQDVGKLPLKKYPGRLRLEALTDKDPGILDLDSEEEEPTAASSSACEPPEDGPALSPGWSDLMGSQPEPITAQDPLEKEEELVIEEYDSD
ncbi:RAD17 protein, partial [Atractosteus spatula]|nr:RAD17 protein [Atractosteus spatula]